MYACVRLIVFLSVALHPLFFLYSSRYNTHTHTHHTQLHEALHITLAEAEEMVYEAKLNASAAWQSISHNAGGAVAAGEDTDVDKALGLLEAKREHKIGALVRVDGMKKFGTCVSMCV